MFTIRVDDVHVNVAAVHVDTELAGELLQRLTRLEGKVDALLSKGDSIMSLATDIKGLIKAVDDRTNEVADNVTTIGAGITEVGKDLQALRDQIAAGQLSAQEAADIKQALSDAAAKLGTQTAALKAESETLAQLGQDPGNPVPDPVPVDNPPVEQA